MRSLDQPSRFTLKWLRLTVPHVIVENISPHVLDVYAQVHSEWFGPGEVSHFADQRFWLPARVVDWHETLELAITIYESSLRQLKCALISTGKTPSMETKRVCKNIELRDELQ